MNSVGKSISRERKSMREDGGPQRQCPKGAWPFCRGHGVPSGLGSVTSHHCRGSRNLRHTNASFSFSRSLIPATQPCQQRQLTAGQLQSTKRERIRNRENSHRSHRGHLAVGTAFSLLPFLPTLHRTRVLVVAAAITTAASTPVTAH